MIKKIIALWVVCFLPFSSVFAEGIEGFWKAVNEKGREDCIVAVYEYDGMWYGRIIGTYNDEGVMDDTIYHPVERAPGVKENPYYSGMDIIWNLRPTSGGKYRGKIVDPEKGKVYKAELWVNQYGELVVRGELLFFGRNQEWPAAQDSDFPKGFQKPDVSTFVPEIPRVK